MRVSTEEKERSRDRILAAAGRLFRERGVQGASVGDIMGAAGMTHGGFYRHFADKGDLLAAALAQAFESFVTPLAESAEATGATDVDGFRKLYLSLGHLRAPGKGCPAAALGPDIARAGGTVRAAFGAGVNRMIEGLTRRDGREDDTAQAARTDAMRDLAMMVGAVVLARGGDNAFASEILQACARPAG